MKRLLLLSAAAALLLASCKKAEEENVAVQSERASKALQDRYNQLEAEAENGADSAAAPYDNEAETLLNQIAGNVQASNAAAPAPAKGPSPRR